MYVLENISTLVLTMQQHLNDYLYPGTTCNLQCFACDSFHQCNDIMPTHRQFDASLKSRDPTWGIRDLEAVIDVASANGLDFVQSIEMPANNLCVLFCKK